MNRQKNGKDGLVPAKTKEGLGLGIIAKYKDKLWEMFRFAVNGGASFLVDYGIMVALVELAGFSPFWASGISFTVSVVVNYLICVLWVFKGEKNTGVMATVVFIGSSVVGLGLNQLFMWLFVDVCGIYYMVAKVIATLLVMIWNYIAKRKALYSKKKGKAEE